MTLSDRLARLLTGTSYQQPSSALLTRRQIGIDVLSGLTVALALVPEAVAKELWMLQISSCMN